MGMAVPNVKKERTMSSLVFLGAPSICSLKRQKAGVEHLPSHATWKAAGRGCLLGAVLRAPDRTDCATLSYDHATEMDICREQAYAIKWGS